LLERIKGLVKDESGQITTTEVVILVAVIALLASLFGDGLKDVFIGNGSGSEKNGGVVGQLRNFIDKSFGEAMRDQINK